MKVENDRNKVKDGNYLLWQADMQAFGKLIDLPEILEQIGGIALMAHEAREEQDGTVIRPLPTATDPRFIVEPAEAPAEESAAVENEQPAEAPAEESAAVENEQPAEAPAEESGKAAEDPEPEAETDDQEVADPKEEKEA